LFKKPGVNKSAQYVDKVVPVFEVRFQVLLQHFVFAAGKVKELVAVGGFDAAGESVGIFLQADDFQITFHWSTAFRPGRERQGRDFCHFSVSRIAAFGLHFGGIKYKAPVDFRHGMAVFLSEYHCGQQQGFVSFTGFLHS
jgi:hypothetical protein